MAKEEVANNKGIRAKIIFFIFFLI
jgi:hypothetical protein